MGVIVHVPGTTGIQNELALLRVEWLRLGIDKHVECINRFPDTSNSFRLQLDDVASSWMPDFDTLDLASRLKFDSSEEGDDQLREIWLALLRSPVLQEFPSAEELLSAVRIRQNIVRNASRTCLNFAPLAIERPADCWRYSEKTGFVLVPGKPLIESLRKACQPEVGGQLYAFSCYRASEYVLLLSIAEEAEQANPELLQRLQSQWEHEAVTSENFHDVFLDELGSLSSPLPMNWFVPGDRVWFRNPDEHSSNVYGYEGSWVFYLGRGLFSNFWKCDRPFNLTEKCVEIYHWRDSTWRDADGVLQIDEAALERRVARTLANPAELGIILERMHRFRDPQGVYADGGCMDATREVTKWIRPPHGRMISLLDRLT